MIAPTHSFISVFFSLVVLSFWDFSIGVMHLCAMIIFAWLPDLDSPSSLIGRVTYYLSKRLAFWFGHRGLLHSIPFLLLLVFLTSPVFFIFNGVLKPFLIILYVAYFSHIIADCFTVSGVRLLYPSPTLYVFPKNELFRFHTGDLRIETLISTVFLFLSLVYFFTIVRSDGLVSFLRINFASSKMAEDQFSSFEGFKYRANAKIFDKTTRSEIVLSNTEVLFADKVKLITYERPLVKLYEEGDFYTFRKVSLSRSVEKFQIQVVSNYSLSVLVDQTNFVAFTGHVFTSVAVSFDGVTRDSSSLKLFYVPIEGVRFIQSQIAEENKKIEEQVTSISIGTSFFKAQAINSQIAALNKQREFLLNEQNKTKKISEEISYSSRVRQIESRVQTLQLDLISIDSSGDAVVSEKLKELKSKLVTNALCEGVLIR
jgi:membrane-bound metal-dependent hydrolase YbcI (DUF457 family)